MARTTTTKLNNKHPIHIETAADHDTVQDAMSDEPFDFRSFLAMAGVELPSGKRLLIGFIVGLAASYLTGSAVMQVTAALMIGTFALTTSAFLVNCVWVLGLVLAAIASFKAFGVVNRWIIGGKIEAGVAKQKDRFMGWLNTASAPKTA